MAGTTVPTLGDLLREDGVLPVPVVGGWVGRLLAGTGAQRLGEQRYALSVNAEGVQLDLQLSASLEDAGLRLVLDLTGSVLSTRWFVLPAGVGQVTLDVDAAGLALCAVPDDASLGGASFDLAGPGPTGVTVSFDDVQVRPSEDLRSIVLAVSGSIAVSGLPMLGVDPARPLDFEATWGLGGITGSASGVVGDSVFVSVAWSDSHDWRPSSLLVDAPLQLPQLPQLPVNHSARARLSAGRNASDGMDAVLEVVAEDSIVSSLDERAVVAAALLAACAAEHVGSGGLAETSAILATAGTLATLLAGPGGPSGSAEVTRARVDLTRPDRITFDYRSQLHCHITTPVFEFLTTAPMRAVVRDVVLQVAPEPALDWHAATVEVGDPGQWKVVRPHGVLQVDKVRSGHGSQWFELDLRFGLDLGPVEVQSATVRVTFPGPTVSLRGFGIGIDVPGLVTGSGSLSVGEPRPGRGSPADSASMLHASLGVGLVPLGGLEAQASVSFGTVDGHPSLSAAIDLDLASPVPIASTGLGLFGVSGIVGLNHDSGFPEDPPGRLAWDPSDMQPAGGRSTIGLKVAVGTLPDLGHGFGAVGKLAVTTPQLAVVAAVAARLLGSRPSVIDPPTGAGPTLLGSLAIIPDDQISLSVLADYAFPQSTSWKLFSASAPVEARWTRARPSAWYVHLGTDSSRYPGPVRATVLSGILPDDLLHAEAFLMVEGDGLTGLVVHTATSGLVVAAGIDVGAKLVSFPATADVYARGVMAVSTHPVFLAGRIEVGGRLSLGPFGLGVHATMDLQVGPGDVHWADVEICGEIDLWLVDLSGCVGISLGSHQNAPPPLDPPVSPVVSITIADVHGAAPTVRAAEPTCWPDAVLQVGFLPGPNPDSVGGPFLVPAPPRPMTGVVGDPSGYRAEYRLTRLDLEVDGAALPLEPIPATWQVKPGQAAVGADGAAVLALNTYDNALWAGYLPDAGASDPSDLPGARRVECQGTPWVPRPGWAVGAHADRLGPARWSLPPAPVQGSPSGLDSVVRVLETRTRWPATAPVGSTDAGPGATTLLPPGVLGVRGEVVRHPISAAGAEFDGWLALPDVEFHRLEVLPPPSTTTLRLAERVVSGGVLVLVGSRGLRPSAVVSHGDRWVVDVDAWDDLEVTIWRPPNPDTAFTEVVITHATRQGAFVPPDPNRQPDTDPPFVGLGVVAVGGVTQTAHDTAVTVSTTKPFTRPTPVPDPSDGPSAGPLVVGARHTLTVTWEAMATLQGQSVVTGSRSDRQSFTVAGPQPVRPDPRDLLSATHVFHPAMLERYLRSYWPDGSTPWFTDDEVGAVVESSLFTVARAYRLVPTLAVTPTDDSSGRLPVDAIDVVAEGVDLLSSELGVLAGGTALRCALPHGPVRLQGQVPLLPNRAYDICLDLLPSAHDPHPLDYDDGRLTRVSFRTSRWASAEAMFADAGFGGPGTFRYVAAGGPLGAGVVAGERSDGALAAALAGTVVPPLEVPIRATVLVQPRPDAAQVAGVLIESQEPLQRGSALDALTLRGDGTPWPSFHDRGGITALFVSPAPTTGSVGLQLSWSRRGQVRQVSSTLTAGRAARVAALLGGGH